MAGDDRVQDPPRKRIRLESPERNPGNSGRQSDVEKERRVGITAYVSPDTAGFYGILKQRYTDFQVNEIALDGTVLHLTDLCWQQNKSEKVEEVETTQDQPKVEANTEQAPVTKETTDADNSLTDIAKEQNKDDVTIKPEDITTLQEIFGESISAEVIKLHDNVLKRPDRKARDFTSVKSETIEDKQKRTNAHNAIRRIFSSRLETVTESDDTITIKAFPPNLRGNKGRRDGRQANSGERRGKIGWNELGGEWLHFSLYKENKDTMEVLSFLGSQLKIDQKNFRFAGTKDRRAVTVQRISVKRLESDRLKRLGPKLRNAAIGGLSYHTTGLELGDLTGNEFVIVLRDCHFPGEESLPALEKLQLAQRSIAKAVADFRQKGFLNYFGLQRFGSFAATTDAVGLKMLQDDLEGAVNKILDFDAASLAAAYDLNSTSLVSSDDRARAESLDIWKTSKDSKQALAKLPRKFSAETNIIRHLSRPKCHNDYQGSLMAVSRNLRSMYVHAYQSRVWNTVASKRWELFGDKVVEGDLVLIHEHDHKATGHNNGEDVDQEGEVIVRPLAEDRATVGPDGFERARALTRVEAESARYNIFDIVLPLPGFDVEYPKNAIGEFYKEFMGSESGGGLDPHDMRRRWKEISLSGSYRKIIGRPGPGMGGEVREYFKPEEQLEETDMDRLNKRPEQEVDDPSKMDVNNSEEKKLAVILKFQLGTSQYATMALRELMKDGGLVAYKPEYSGRG